LCSFIPNCHGEKEHSTKTVAGMTTEQPVGPAGAAPAGAGGEPEQAPGPHNASAAAAAGGGGRDYGGAAASLRDPACRAGTAEFAAAKAEVDTLLQTYRARRAALDAAGVRLGRSCCLSLEHNTLTCWCVVPSLLTAWCCCAAAAAALPCAVLPCAMQQIKSDMVAWKEFRQEHPLARRPPSYGHIPGSRACACADCCGVRGGAAGIVQHKQRR
jgi:hypothetical protein